MATFDPSQFTTSLTAIQKIAGTSTTSTSLASSGSTSSTLSQITSVLANGLTNNSPDYFQSASQNLIQELNPAANTTITPALATSITSYPTDIQHTIDYYFRMSFYQYVRPTPVDVAHPQPLEVIYLPLPLDLQESQGVSWEAGQYGPTLGAILDNFGGTFQEAANQLNAGNFTDDAITKIQNAFSTDMSKGGSLLPKGGAALRSIIQDSGLSQRYLGSTAIENTINQTLGNIPNPHLTVFFSGPKLRDMTFNWRFAPTNAQDTANLRSIVGKIKMHSLSKFQASSGHMLLNYPDMCTIDLVVKGNQNLYYIKKCVVSDINISYTDQSAVSFHVDGNPTSFTVQMNVQEIEYHTAGDYTPGGSSGYGANARALEAGTNTIINPTSTASVTPTGRPIDATTQYSSNGMRAADSILDNFEI